MKRDWFDWLWLIGWQIIGGLLLTGAAIWCIVLLYVVTVVEFTLVGVFILGGLLYRIYMIHPWGPE